MLRAPQRSRPGGHVPFGSALAVLGGAARRVAAVLRVPTPKSDRNTTLGLAALVPWAWFALLIGLVVRARAASSFWPTPLADTHAGSSNADFDWLMMYTLPPALLLVALFAIASLTVLARREIGRAVLVVAASAACVFALIALDPGGVLGSFVR